MKKVINGALYNTETAQQLASYSNTWDTRDFSYYRETLYRTKSGKFFLHGYGGGNSKYGEWHGNSGGPGEQIRAYTPEEARQWAEEHLDGDNYIAIFGEPEEAADNRVTLNLTVPANVKAALERLRSETGKSISQLVAEKFAE